MRRYGGGRYHKVEVYYWRTLYLDGQPIAHWEGWAWTWKLDWSLLRQGIDVGALYKLEARENEPLRYQDGNAPPSLRQMTEEESDAYAAKARESAAEHKAWNNEHPHQAWMRSEEAAGRDPYSNFFPAKEPEDVP